MPYHDLVKELPSLQLGSLIVCCRLLGIPASDAFKMVNVPFKKF